MSLVSDYVFRGVTQTRGGEALQADVHWHSDGGWLAGAWGSTVDPNPGPGPTIEINLYAGVARELSDGWVARLLAIHYLYPNDHTTLRWDYDELAASLAFRDRVAATIAWSPNYSSFGAGQFVEDRTTMSYELSAQLPFRQRWLACAGAGYQDLAGLQRLAQGIERLGLEQANASQHLSVLRVKQILKSRKEGNQVFYSVRDPVLLQVLDIMRRYFQSHVEETMSMLREIDRSDKENS